MSDVQISCFQGCNVLVEDAVLISHSGWSDVVSAAAWPIQLDVSNTVQLLSCLPYNRTPGHGWHRRIVTARTIRFEVLRKSFESVLRSRIRTHVGRFWRFAVLMAFPHNVCGGAQMAPKDIEPSIKRLRVRIKDLLW